MEQLLDLEDLESFQTLLYQQPTILRCHYSARLSRWQKPPGFDPSFALLAQRLRSAREDPEQAWAEHKQGKDHADALSRELAVGEWRKG